MVNGGNADLGGVGNLLDEQGRANHRRARAERDGEDPEDSDEEGGDEEESPPLDPAQPPAAAPASAGAASAGAAAPQVDLPDPPPLHIGGSTSTANKYRPKKKKKADEQRQSVADEIIAPLTSLITQSESTALEQDKAQHNEMMDFLRSQFASGVPAPAPPAPSADAAASASK